MAVLSKISLSRLEGVDYRLQDLCHRLIAMWDFTVVYGLRTQSEQAELVARGLSKTMNSKHLTGKAVDLAPYPIDWNDTKRFYYFAGMVMALAAEMGIKLRWGGNWDMDYDLNDNTFMDLVHFELVE